ncbi:MAG: hypothetical protein RL536_365 [Candidatus Parcubacteria bacterium]
MSREELHWVKSPKGSSGGRELIYRGQYFWSKWYGGGEHLYSDHPKLAGEGFIGAFTGCCHFCNLGIDDAVRRFKPRKKTRTQYTNWRRCDVGFCNRMTVLVNGYKYWAKHVPSERKVAVYASHLGRTPIGYLPERLVPVELLLKMKQR